MSRCIAQNANHVQCYGRAMTGSDLCYSHALAEFVSDYRTTVERLDREIEVLNAAQAELLATTKRLDAEIKRLRAALKQIADGGGQGMSGQWCAVLAHRALGTAKANESEN